MPTHSQQEGWLVYKSVPLGLHFTDSGNVTRKLLVLWLPVILCQRSLPSCQPRQRGRHGRALAEGRVFSQVSDRHVSSSMQERKERTPEDLGSWRAIRLRFVYWFGKYGRMPSTMPVPSCRGYRNEWDIVPYNQESMGDRHIKRQSRLWRVKCKAPWNTPEPWQVDTEAGTPRVN